LDCETLVALQTRNSLISLLKTDFKAAKEQLCLEAINILAKYRSDVSSGSNVGEFVIPKTLNNYPLFIYSAMRSIPFCEITECTRDRKIYDIYQLLSCSLSSFLVKIYTRMYSIREIRDSYEKWGSATDNFTIMKAMNLPTSYQEMLRNDGYIFCTADYIWIYLPLEIDIELLREVFYI